nr:hypothetical protein [Tanacetum cinerariifolium]
MWKRIRRLMHGFEKTKQQRHSRLVDKFDKFVTVEGESLSFVYERLTILVNVMDQIEIRPLPITINTKFLNSLQPEWSKYVTMTRQNADLKETEYDHLFDTLSQYEPHRLPRTELNPRKPSVHCYNYNEKGHYARDCPQPKVRDAKYFKEQMLLAMKDEPGSNLNEEENDFMLDNHYGDDSLEELNAATIGEVNVSQIYSIGGMRFESVHEHTNHSKLKTAINISNDDKIDSSIIFDDPYVENNSRKDEHDSNAHDQSVTLESLIQNVQKEAKNPCSLNNELKKQKALLQKELKMCKERVKILEKQPVKSWNHKDAYEELE